jgi:hypothetical protein
MVIKRIRTRIPAACLRAGPVFCCVLGTLIALVAAGAGFRRVHAQSAAQTSADTQATGNQNATGQNATSQNATSQNATGQDATGQDATGQDATGKDATPNAAAEAQSPGAAAGSAKASGEMPAEQQRKQEVATDCASLLKMATDLKAEIAKTTKDELSIPVVRKAGEIEQLARKVRGDPRLTAGKE